MSEQTHDFAEYADTADFDESPDFAEEHTDTTVGDGDGEHEEEPEPESPRGLGGMDIPPNPLREL